MEPRVVTRTGGGNVRVVASRYLLAVDGRGGAIFQEIRISRGCGTHSGLLLQPWTILHDPISVRIDESVRSCCVCADRYVIRRVKSITTRLVDQFIGSPFA